ncbi:MAG TPA: flagellar filament capping protein FliD [Croceibacterium sp.]|nr:flagellar filament capping protein FliD [Croceibacterium sp.]
MTETSTASSIISALGAGSGVDMTALAKNLADAQFAGRTQRLTAKSEALEQKISVAASLKNSLSLLASALGDRVRAGDLAVTPQIANASVATVSSPSGTAQSGSYSLEVLSLAKGQTLASSAFASGTSTVGAGSLTIRFGTTTGSSFTEDTAHTAVTIDVVSGATLADVAQSINASKSGVTAYVATTAEGAQLVLKGATGELNGFVIEATETAGEEGLAALAWNPSAGGDPAKLLATSANASFKLDGLTMTSASNTIANAAPGLSLSLTGTNAGAPTQITFSSPVSSISEAMADLIAAFNEIMGELNSATNALGGGALGTDAGARGLKRTLTGIGSTIIMPNAAEGSPRTLADLGLAVERDGTFRLDTARLQATLQKDPAGAAAMFTTGLYGVYATVDKIARAASTTSDPGSLAGSIARYESQSKEITEQTAKVAEQQERLRASLTTRFAKTDAQVASSKSTLSFLQAQIDAWNAQRD